MSTIPFQLSPSVRIGVLRGGPSPEYDISLKSGEHVLSHLRETHKPVDIFIGRDGAWHMHGVPRSPDRILKHVDVVFNALHGAYGEDGGVQEILEHHGVPYTGSDRFSSAMAMNKHFTKERVRAGGIKTPISVMVRNTENISSVARNIFSSFPHPLIVKPTSGGSSLGLYLVDSIADLTVALETIFAVYDSAVVEEYISGREVTCAVVDDFRGQEVYALPIIEIITSPESPLFDYHSKYIQEAREICPAHIPLDMKREIERQSAQIHSLLELSHYSRSDFIISPTRGMYFLEVNSLPGMTTSSLMPKSFEAVGVTMPEFIHHVLRLALNHK